MSAAPSPIHGGPLTELRPGLWLEKTSGGAILHGEPRLLTRICAALGWKHSGRNRVFLHPGNVARLDGVFARLDVGGSR